MPKLRTGYVYQKDKKWYARFDYVDEQGKRRKVKRIANPNTKTAAKELLKQLLSDFEKKGRDAVAPEIQTFDALADYYEKRYLIPPQYVEGRKVAGVRTHYNGKLYLGVLRQHFGKKQLASLTYRDIDAFRLKRIKTPTKHRKQRSIASVNRELELLRRVLNVAVREGWLHKNPFNAGDPLISKADEKQRQRILSYEEEERLLAACTGRREHLRSILVFQLDMGTRRNEAFTLAWADVDFNAREVTVKEINSKTAKARTIGMTERVREMLWTLYQESNLNPETLVFGITDNVKKSFAAARKQAGLDDVRLHDLRHTFCSRLVEAEIPIAEGARVSGHDQLSTFYRYVNANSDTIRRASAALDDLRRRKNNSNGHQDNL
ncbi:MAG TPA: site-specific integrase [Blastocatellia bacterium]|nr:site-specific integrase [Blastocatellia bacterium]